MIAPPGLTGGMFLVIMSFGRRNVYILSPCMYSKWAGLFSTAGHPGTSLSDSYNTDDFIQSSKLFRYMYVSCGYASGYQHPWQVGNPVGLSAVAHRAPAAAGRSAGCGNYTRNKDGLRHCDAASVTPVAAGDVRGVSCW